MSTSELLPYLPDEGWFRFDLRGLHGAPHPTRLLDWADVLAGTIAGPGALCREELRCAAAVHDVGRINDGTDCGHGSRSAQWVVERLATERPSTRNLDFDLIAELCRWHETPDREIGRLSLKLLILKDADGLDRVRLGDLNPARLRLARSLPLVAATERLERATNRYGSVTGPDVLETAEQLGATESQR